MGASADAIKGSSAKVYWITIDNTANSVSASYVKLYNLAAGSVTVGTTVPDEIIYVPADVVITHVFSTGANPGKTFPIALAACCVTAGGTAGVTPPVGGVIVSVCYV